MALPLDGALCIFLFEDNVKDRPAGFISGRVLRRISKDIRCLSFALLFMP